MKVQLNDAQAQFLKQTLTSRQAVLLEQLSLLNDEFKANETLIISLEGNAPGEAPQILSKPMPVEAAKKQWDKGDKRPVVKAAAKKADKVHKGDDERRKKYLKIRELLREGLSIAEACKKVGCTDATYYNWLRKFGTQKEITMLGTNVSKYGPKKKPVVKEEPEPDASEREELQPGEEDEEVMRARLIGA